MLRRSAARLPFGPLEDYANTRFAVDEHGDTGGFGPLPPLTGRRLAEALGVSPNTVITARRGGLSWQYADTLAVRLGLHPCALWPEWFTIDADIAAAV